MIRLLESCGDRLLARLVPRVSAAAQVCYETSVTCTPLQVEQPCICCPSSAGIVSCRPAGPGACPQRCYTRGR